MSSEPCSAKWESSPTLTSLELSISHRIGATPSDRHYVIVDKPQVRAKSVPAGEKAKLWKMAMGLCSFKGCWRDLHYSGSDSPQFGAHVAHIAAESATGPRGDDPTPMSERHLYPNLILLCPSHHDEIDTNPELWPSEAVRQMKAEHEAKIKELQHAGVRWSERYLSVDYVNVPRLLAFDSGRALDRLTRWGVSDLRNFESLGYELRLRVLHATSEAAEDWHDRAVPIDSGRSIEAGQVVSFKKRFYIKNIAATRLTRDLESDPHLWTRHGDRRLVIRLDPSWITTATAFSSGAHGSFSGIAVVVDQSTAQTVASGIVIGQPMSPMVEEFYK